MQGQVRPSREARRTGSSALPEPGEAVQKVNGSAWKSINMPSPAAFRSRDRGPQLTISGCVFLAGRAKRWEAQVRFASPISAVLGITDAARPRGGGSGARDSVPAADLVSGSEVNRSWSAAEDGRLCRTDLTLGVQSPWGGAGAVRMAVQTWRGDTASGPGREGQRARPGGQRPDSGRGPAQPRGALHASPLLRGPWGMRRQPGWRRPGSLDGLEAERRAGKVRGPTRLSQQAGPSALRVHTSLVKPGPLPAATATPLPVAAAAGTTVPRPRRSEGASLGGGARRCLVQRPRAARKTCGRHVGTQPRAAGRAGRRPWKGRGHCPWPGPLVCAADAHTGRAPVPTGREALAAPPPSSALCGLPAVGCSWMWAR